MADLIGVQLSAAVAARQRREHLGVEMRDRKQRCGIALSQRSAHLVSSIAADKQVNDRRGS